MRKCRPASSRAQHFLWLDEEPDRAEKIRTKGPYIAPMVKDIPRKVPSGLIHDWLGVGFVPNAKIEDILRIVRDYDRYKDIYRPGVIDSAFRRTDGMQDFFSMRLANRSVVAKTARKRGRKRTNRPSCSATAVARLS